MGKMPKIKKEPMRKIDFQVDTLSHQSETLAYYDGNRKTITLNFYKPKTNNQNTNTDKNKKTTTPPKKQTPQKAKGHNSKPITAAAPKDDNEGNKAQKFNDYSNGLGTILHEQKHRDSHRQGLYDAPLGAEEAYKLDMWNEISANMTTLVYLRNQYIKSGDSSIFETEENGNFKFYKDAIDKGEINPNSPYKEDFDKDMSLIVNGTKDMWMEKYSMAYGLLQNPYNAAQLAEEGNEHAADYQNNYEKGKKIALNIGGTDFTKYIKNDVEIPDIGQIIMEDIKPLPVEEADKKLSNKEFAEKYDLPEYDGSISLLEYQKLLQHDILTKNTDQEAFSGTAKEIADNKKNNTNNNSARIIGQANLINSKNTLMQNVKIITAAVDAAKNDYAKAGKKLPPDNEALYNQKADQMYSVYVEGEKINVRETLEADSNLVLTELEDDKKTKESFKPKYRKWEDKDGSRVSPVLQMKIPDMNADYIQKPTKSYDDEQNNSNGLKKTLQTQAAERTAKAAESKEPLKTQLKEDAEKHKLQKTESAYQYSPDRPLNEQLQEAAANSKTAVQNDNTDELNRVRKKAASRQAENRESENTASSPEKYTAENGTNNVCKISTRHLIAKSAITSENA